MNLNELKNKAAKISDETPDWKSIGFLEGLSDEQQKIVVKYFNQVDLNKLIDNEDLEGSIFAVVRYIITNIIDSKETNNPSYIYHYIQKDHVINGVEELLGYVDVNEITGQLKTYYNEFIPLGEKYLPDVDSQAELTVLFCQNYLYKIVEKIRNK